MTGELDPAVRELILLVNKHGSPAAVRALAGLLNEVAELRRQRDEAHGSHGGDPSLIASPRSGRTVLACSCGKILDLAEMRRMPASTGDRTLVRPIVCSACAWSRRPG